MYRLLIITLLMLFSTLPVSAKNVWQTVNLDNIVSTSLLDDSVFYYDSSDTAGIDTVMSLSEKNWGRFNREQFQLGFVNSPLWVRTRLQTVGSDASDVALVLHKSMDRITLYVQDEGGHRQTFALGKGTMPTDYHIEAEANLSHVTLSLKPNTKYLLWLRINSKNPIVGSFTIDNPIDVEHNATQKNQWVLSYVLLIVLISFYNFVIYLSTRHKAFALHIGYLLSVLVYLINDYGYLSLWLDLYNVEILQKITATSLLTAYLSLLSFIRIMNNVDAHTATVRRLHALMYWSGYLLLAGVLFIPYEYLIRLISIQICMGVVIGLVRLFHPTMRHAKKLSNNDPKLMILRVVLVVFVPAVVLHLIARLGLIPLNWFADFVLFFSVILEVMLISGILFLNIRKSNTEYQREKFSHHVSHLPNERALERHFLNTKDTEHQTLIKIWVSGLDKLEITFGPTLYARFIEDIATEMRQVLAGNPNLVSADNNNEYSVPLFHIDKNTFCLLCQALDYDSRRGLVAQLNQATESIRHINQNSIDLEVMTGAHEFCPVSTDYQTVMLRTNQALSYSIKNNKTFKYYNPQIGFDERQRITLLNDFQKSLEDDEFFLLWQPQYNAVNNKLSGAEVLTRWQHHEYGLIGPDIFIPLLERSTRICSLSHWVIGQVFKDLPALQEKHPGIEVSINLSSRDLNDNSLIEYMDSKVAQAPELVPFITLEITESMMINDYSKALKNIKKLQERGFDISIDDFGSGFASLAYLQKLPANELKIDKSYTDCYAEPKTAAIVESIIGLAQRLDMRIVVEGVEHWQQAELFKDLGAERLQGWLLDKPMSIHSLLGRPQIYQSEV